MSKVERLLKGVAREHFTNEELELYHKDAVDESTRDWMTAHLDLCLICERKLARIETMEDLANVTTTEEEFVRGLIPQILGQETPNPFATLKDAVAEFQAKLRSLHIHFEAASGVHAATEDSKAYRGETENGLCWNIMEEKSGSLFISLGSSQMEWKEYQIAVTLGHIQKIVTLEVDPVTEDQVGADFVFTQQERSELSSEPEIQLALVGTSG